MQFAVSEEQFDGKPAIVRPSRMIFILSPSHPLGNGKYNAPSIRRHQTAGSCKCAVAKIQKQSPVMEFLKRPAAGVPSAKESIRFHHIPFDLAGAEQ